MSNWFLRIGVLYFVVGVALGLGMAMSGVTTLRPVHVHLNLLGWASMMLFGLFYRAVPAAAETKLAKAHFWIYVPAHLVQMVTLTMYYNGNKAVDPILGLSSMVVGAAVLCFAAVVWQHTGNASVSQAAKPAAAGAD